MKNELHTVLGGTGTIGNEIVKILLGENKSVRSVARTTNIAKAQNVAADLLHLDSTIEAIAGSTYVYLCIMLPYNGKIWMRDWPMVMRNTIIACSKANATLIFLDNTYMYESSYIGVIQENYGQNPLATKGIARKKTVNMLLDAIHLNKVRGVIGRSSDFYGPNAIHSQFYIKFLENMLKGRDPQALMPIHKLHAYSYTGDVAKGLTMLAMNSDTYGSVWHLPTNEPITMSEISMIFNTHLKVAYKVKKLPKPIRKFLCHFNKDLKEVDEMLYQFEHDSFFSSSKFNQRFPDFKTTSYSKGIASMIDSFVG